jgi:hypothetical protein
MNICEANRTRRKLLILFNLDKKLDVVHWVPYNIHVNISQLVNKQWRSQPDNFVPLCKFKIIIIIHFFRNWLFSQSMSNEHENICIAGLNSRAGYATVNKMCSQQACIASLSTSCNNAVIWSSCYTSLSLTICWQIVELQDDNNLLEQLITSLLSPKTLHSKLATSRWQLVNKLGTSSANTSFWQVVGTALLQVYLRLFTTYVFLRVDGRKKFTVHIISP